MKIIKGKPRYEKTFFRFLEYYAGVKACSLKRNIIAKMAFDNFCNKPIFDKYINGGSSLDNLYSFYIEFNKSGEFKEFFVHRKRKLDNVKSIKTYRKVSGVSYQKFYETKEWIDLSKTVKKIYGKICMKCGDSKSIMHSDHIIPRSLDISKELDINNLQVLCELCNVEKSNLNCIDYRTDIDKMKLESYLNKTIFVDPKITFKSWIDLNRKKIGKAQIEILIELWDKKNQSC
jgi:hypothetical protein